jgi:hypothetical protein
METPAGMRSKSVNSSRQLPHDNAEPSAFAVSTANVKV